MREAADLLIDGQWAKAGGEVIVSVNPATGEVLYECQAATKNDVDRAVGAALSAFPAWSRLSIDKRAEYLKKFVKDFTDFLKSCRT